MSIKRKVLPSVAAAILTLSGFCLLQGIARHNEEIEGAPPARRA